MTRIKTASLVLAGALLAITADAIYEAGQYISRTQPPSAESVHKPLQPFTVDPSWIKSGTPNFRAAETARTADSDAITGLWACDGPTTFEWTFGLDETVHLLEGKVEVDYLGERFTLNPGSTAMFRAGTKATWHVPVYAKKVFKLTRPNLLLRVWRKVFPHRA